MKSEVTCVGPGHFEPKDHFYPRTLNANIHPMIRYFMNLGNSRIASRYHHLHPEVKEKAIHVALNYQPRFFYWGGADLMHVTSETGQRSMVVIETNSCPSGQKSMPCIEENEYGNYYNLLERSFVPLTKKRNLPKGRVAVLYDKNYMEVSGYAATLGDMLGEEVFIVPCFQNAESQNIRFDDDGVMEILYQDSWIPIRAAVRYVTQKPWKRIPVMTRTLIYNPILVCLSGGRNKLLASKAYDFYNAELKASGLQIQTPETIWDVSREEVPVWVERMGGMAVVKNPYSNAGQGVYTITGERELDEFMESAQDYDQFIVQAMIGNFNWTSVGANGKLFHVGTVPDKRMRIYVYDLRFICGSSPSGFFPVAIYARRAGKSLVENIDPDTNSWEMLGTNLSKKVGEDEWTTAQDRLLLMDTKDFNKVGLGLDHLIEAYMQTLLSMIAIDKMAARLLTKKGVFRRKLFQSINPDPSLAEEILHTWK